MELFFELEIVYIIIGIFILAVTAVVTTREFMPKVAFMRGMISVVMLLATMISVHYFMTTSRMAGVKEIFNNGETIICENKMRRTISRSVLLSKELGWRLDGDKFKNDDYERDFHSSRCIEFDGIVPK
ncbi:hypothetical protein SMGD1_1436 [Sulfurimonas gotlandica GD1]|uniref:Uncharacterized protein n=1 Tax=Sulfurimonas gotlandica (strain DSM 19862 / JCM 16533 / GD1) TaxID=929558 RepID=B6BHG4_SULGG|nr:hypothetical protein [Sulfurimonas gotlandica]EDZ63251.1 conserved hypothetical protein [Sulfurimonas gotlandica GD1]EHP29960.1 hypothetical protein SMGD1_1436 [Sulfurimonas gotlandica GD1]